MVLAGSHRKLCLTLGALAEIEAALDVSGVAELADRLRDLSARDLLAVLAAVLRGGGERALAAELDQAAIDPVEAAEAVALAFVAACG